MLKFVLNKQDYADCSDRKLYGDKECGSMSIAFQWWIFSCDSFGAEQPIFVTGLLYARTQPYQPYAISWRQYMLLCLHTCTLRNSVVLRYSYMYASWMLWKGGPLSQWVFYSDQLFDFDTYRAKFVRSFPCNITPLGIQYFKGGYFLLYRTMFVYLQ